MDFRPAGDEDWLKGVGTPLTAQLAEWRDELGTLDAMIATYREYNLKHHDRMVTVYPGVMDAVREIKAAGLQTGLVTSKNRLGALRGLTLVGLEALMDVLVCADEVTNPKPHPEPVEKAVDLLGDRSQPPLSTWATAYTTCTRGGRPAYAPPRRCGDRLAGLTWRSRSRTTGWRRRGTSYVGKGKREREKPKSER